MLTTNVTGDATLIRQLRIVSLSSEKKKQINKRLAKAVVEKSYKRTKTQREINGGMFDRRKKGNKKMLPRIARRKLLKTKVKVDSAIVGYKNKLTGRIATVHQEGYRDQYNSNRMKKERGTPDYDAAATSEQAKSLKKEGFKLKTGKYKSGKNKGKAKSKRVSQSWIKENMSLGQAGLVLRILRENKAKQSWVVKTPPRPFLGLTRQELREEGHEFVNGILSNAKRKK